MNNYLGNDYRAFIHTSRYARWIDAENRRETWAETINRYISNIIPDGVDHETTFGIEQALLNCEVTPSMRALMTAGPALERDNTAAYNCAYLAVDDL